MILRQPFHPRRTGRGLRIAAAASAIAILACAAGDGRQADGAPPPDPGASPAPQAAGAEVPADAVLRDFEPTGDYMLEVDGQTAEGAEIYRSDRVPAYLLVTGRIPAPTLLLPRSGSVETVSLMKLARRADGSVDILADAELEPAGRFTIDEEGEQIRFDVGGSAVVLKPRPYLLGLQELDAMLGYSPDYSRAAASYQPDAGTVAALNARSQPVRVRVYFGSWCPHCKQMVPFVLKVAEELEASPIDFEFYGLPKPFTGEPAAEADDISAVPTAVVWVGGREVGRIEGGDWRHPETALARILNGA
jgi:thiol-disulfide isomerase/thioredoxin